MNVISIILVLLILTVWLFGGMQILRSARKQHGLKRWLGIVAALFLVVGAVGFFGSALSATGGLNWLPPSFEWPAGNASGVVSTKDRFFVVPLTSAGRVQIYDSHWKFIRGWAVDAGGGVFKLSTSNGHKIDVITARGAWHYVYDISGKLLSKQCYSPRSYSSFPESGKSYVVPTSPWLWVFSSPFLSWIAAVMGIVLTGIHHKISSGKSTEARNHSGDQTSTAKNC